MRGVSKHFGGTQALNDAGIDVGEGEIVALLGENGAGKIDADQDTRRRSFA